MGVEWEVDVGAVVAVFALVVSGFSAYWNWRTFVLAPRRDLLRRFSRHYWRVTKTAIEFAVDDSEFVGIINEAKVVFGNDKNVVRVLRSIQESPQPGQLAKLAMEMAKASRLSVRAWPDGFLDHATMGWGVGPRNIRKEL